MSMSGRRDEFSRGRGPGPQWWSTGSDRWLEVPTERDRGGLTDHSEAARQAAGAGSWEHGGRMYLTSQDAESFLTAAGLAEVDIPGRQMHRPPDGRKVTRDAGAASVVEGGLSEANAYFGAMEAPADDDEPPLNEEEFKGWTGGAL